MSVCSESVYRKILVFTRTGITSPVLFLQENSLKFKYTFLLFIFLSVFCWLNTFLSDIRFNIFLLHLIQKNPGFVHLFASNTDMHERIVSHLFRSLFTFPHHLKNFKNEIEILLLCTPFNYGVE